MAYYDVANHPVIVTKSDMKGKMACVYGILRATAVGILHQG